MKEKNTSDRLKEIMAEKGLRQIDILNKAIPFCKKYNVKLGRNDLSQYISGKVEPSQKKLTVLAEALEVNEAWLMGYDISMDDNDQISIIVEKDIGNFKKGQIITNDEELTIYEKTLIEESQRLERENKKLKASIEQREKNILNFSTSYLEIISELVEKKVITPEEYNLDANNLLDLLKDEKVITKKQYKEMLNFYLKKINSD